MTSDDFDSLQRGMDQARDYMAGKTEGCVERRRSAREMFEWAMQRYPKIIARLAE